MGTWRLVPAPRAWRRGRCARCRGREPTATSRRSEDAGQHLLGHRRELLLGSTEIVGPGRRVPDLDAGVGADDDALPVEPGVLAQRRRNGDAALLVRHLVVCGREEDAAVVTGDAGGEWGLTQPGGDAGELLGGKDIEASLLPLGDHEAGRQLVAELCREEQPALLVQPR